MKNQKTTIARFFNGILIADDWDENGKVLGVAIYTDKDKNYHCEPNDLLDDLLNLIQMRVRVEGTMERQPNGKKFIKLKSIEKMEDDVDDDHDTDASF